MISLFGTFISLLCQVLVMAIFARAVISWFPISRDHPLVAILHQVTEPVLDPMRKIIPTMGMIDLTPLVATILLQASPSIMAGSL